MRKAFLIVALLALILGIGGCPTISKEVKDEIHLSFARQERYIELMDRGDTTPEQDKKMLRANLKVFAALDFKINENEEAQKHLKKEDP